MKISRQIKMSAIGATFLAFAGAAGAQTFDDVWVHGNGCVGGGVVTSVYGANNKSTAGSATVTCPIQWARPQGATSGGQLYWISATFWNRSSSAGAFNCKVIGLDESGNQVFNGPTTNLTTGGVGSGPKVQNIGQPPINAVYLSVSCTIPKAGTVANSSSFLSGIGIRVGS